MLILYASLSHPPTSGIYLCRAYYRELIKKDGELRGKKSRELIKKNGDSRIRDIPAASYYRFVLVGMY